MNNEMMNSEMQEKILKLIHERFYNYVQAFAKVTAFLFEVDPSYFEYFGLALLATLFAEGKIVLKKEVKEDEE